MSELLLPYQQLKQIANIEVRISVIGNSGEARALRAVVAMARKELAFIPVTSKENQDD